MGKKVLGKGLSALISSKPSEGGFNNEMSSLDISIISSRSSASTEDPLVNV